MAFCASVDMIIATLASPSHVTDLLCCDAHAQSYMYCCFTVSVELKVLQESPADARVTRDSSACMKARMVEN